MAVEIRELSIKGIVNGGTSNMKKNFEKVNSPLLDSQFVRQLKREIIEECEQLILDKLERKNIR